MFLCGSQTPAFTQTQHHIQSTCESHVLQQGFGNVRWCWWVWSTPTCYHSSAQIHGVPVPLWAVSQKPCQNIMKPIKVNRGHLAFAWSNHLSNTWRFGVFSSKSHMAALNLERRQTDGTKGSLPKLHISADLDNWVLKCWSLPYPSQPDILEEACLTL